MILVESHLKNNESLNEGKGNKFKRNLKFFEKLTCIKNQKKLYLMPYTFYKKSIIMINPIYPCLWFNGQAKEAAEFYCAVFENGKITTDTPMVVMFELHGQQFMGLNGGPQFTINPAISFFVVCETEDEAELVWQKLSDSAKILMPFQPYEWSEKYGWLQDRFGVSWLISLGKLEEVGQKFTPSLLFTQQFAGKAQKAMELYNHLFQPSSIVGVLQFKEGEDEPAGNIKHAHFNINNQVIMLMESTAAHDFTFNEGLSFVVECQTQEEIDFYWYKLSEGGQESMCGWLRDPFGVWWQIIPAIIGQIMTDPMKGGRAMKALMQMKKIEIATLMNA